jgi:NAD(P)-dependent dehydrogenase (short-subunit alcohol dehydrogenase family)
MASPERIMTVNLEATLRLVETMLPLAGPGTVAVLLASTAGHMSAGPEADAAFDAPLKPGDVAGLMRFVPTPEAAYILSKRAVKRLAERQAAAWGQRGARIVSISPGIIDTPMGQLEIKNQPAITAMLGVTPLPRPGTVEEIAGAVAFLCSPDASYVTGADLRIDGGVTAAMSAG